MSLEDEIHRIMFDEKEAMNLNDITRILNERTDNSFNRDQVFSMIMGDHSKFIFEADNVPTNAEGIES